MLKQLCSLVRVTLRAAECASLAFVSLLSWDLIAGPAGPLALRTAGVVPVQFFGPRISDIHLGEIKQELSAEFSKVVRESQRFRVLNDDLILEHWSSPEGRSYLSSEFEIDSFLSLNAVLEEDVIRMSFRILDETLKPVIVEAAAVPYKALKSGHNWASLRSLVFQGINRLPLDASILSVQGAFVSLSAGSSQGLSDGDEFEIFESAVTGVHPADGSWLKFDSKRKGRLKIISTRDVSSVGEIQEETYPGSVSVGQGILISKLRSRAFFTDIVAQKKAGKAETKALVFGESEKIAMTDGTASDLPLAPVVGGEKKTEVPKETAESKKVGSLAEQDEQKKDDKEVLASPSEDETDEGVAEKEKEDEEEEGGGPSLAGSIKDVLRQHDDVSILFANNMWTVSGAASSASKIPFWVFNTVRLRGAIELTGDSGIEWTAGLGLGNAKKTFYTGLSAGAAWVHTEKMQIFRPGDRLRLGVRGLFDTMAVKKEKFGGVNLTRIGGLAGMQGKLKLGSTSLMQRHDLIFDVIGSGQIGVNGKKRAVRTLFGYSLESEIYQDTAGDTAEEWKWGGLFRLSSAKVSAKGASLTLDEKVFGVTIRRFF